jgi:hypothetical protein
MKDTSINMTPVIVDHLTANTRGRELVLKLVLLRHLLRQVQQESCQEKEKLLAVK